jgi:hypothetical protein
MICTRYRRRSVFRIDELGVRGTRSVLQLAGAYMTKTNKLKKRKETRAIARAK